MAARDGADRVFEVLNADGETAIGRGRARIGR